MAIAEEGLKLKRGYVNGAVLLYEIIQQAKRLEVDVVRITNLEKNKAKDARKGFRYLERDEKQIMTTVKNAIEASRNMMRNVLEMQRRFAEAQGWELKSNATLAAQSKAAARWIRPHQGEELQAVESTIKILEQTANDAIAIKQKLIQIKSLV